MQFEPYFKMTITYEDGKSDVINCMPEKTKLSASTKWYLWRDGKRYFAVDKRAAIMNKLGVYWPEGT